MIKKCIWSGRLKWTKIIQFHTYSIIQKKKCRLRHLNSHNIIYTLCIGVVGSSRQRKKEVWRMSHWDEKNQEETICVFILHYGIAQQTSTTYTREENDTLNMRWPQLLNKIFKNICNNEYIHGPCFYKYQLIVYHY